MNSYHRPKRGAFVDGNSQSCSFGGLYPASLSRHITLSTNVAAQSSNFCSESHSTAVRTVGYGFLRESSPPSNTLTFSPVSVHGERERLPWAGGDAVVDQRIYPVFVGTDYLRVCQRPQRDCPIPLIRP